MNKDAEMAMKVWDLAAELNMATRLAAESGLIVEVRLREVSAASDHVRQLHVGREIGPYPKPSIVLVKLYREVRMEPDDD